MKNLSVFVFGVVSYLIGVSALVGWILTMLRVMPFEAGPIHYPNSLGTQIAIGLFLMSIFALQHTIMARSNFKAKISKIIPAAAERSLFVLLTGIVLWGVLIFWPYNNEIIWEISSPLIYKLMIGFAVFGWIYLFAASFAINHFELFGLQQTFNYFRNKTSAKVPFVERLMYKFDRHPLMTGSLIGSWSTPVMRMDHLMFNLIVTAYIIFGVSLEEKSLITQWGDSYLNYKKRVKSLVPTIRL